MDPGSRTSLSRTTDPDPGEKSTGSRFPNPDPTLRETYLFLKENNHHLIYVHYVRAELNCCCQLSLGLGWREKGERWRGPHCMQNLAAGTDSCTEYVRTINFRLIRYRYYIPATGTCNSSLENFEGIIFGQEFSIRVPKWFISGPTFLIILNMVWIVT